MVRRLSGRLGNHYSTRGVWDRTHTKGEVVVMGLPLPKREGLVQGNGRDGRFLNVLQPK